MARKRRKKAPPRQRRKKLWSPCSHVKRYYRTLAQIAFETARKSTEHGYTFCVENSKMRPTQYCSGNECAMIPPSCPGTEETGVVHTHPSGTMSFSADDIKYGFIKNHRFMCLVTPSGEGKCVLFKTKEQMRRESPDGQLHMPMGRGAIPDKMLFDNYLADGFCSLDTVARTKWLTRDDDPDYERGPIMP